MTSLDHRPHFMKIILADTAGIAKLKIPTKFAKTHGNSLSNTLCLRVPNGGMWKVNVVKNDGDLWLQNGWKEFAQHYSLEYGSLLVFRYNGNSNFWVLIFDKTASEIDYPIHNIQCDQDSHLEEARCQNDLPVQILDKCCTHALPQKRKKTNSTSETQNGVNLLPYDSRFATTDTKSNMLKLEKSRRDFRSSHDLGVSTQEKRGNTTSRRQLQLKVNDKASAFMRAEAFHSKSHSCRIKMHPSYITRSRVTVPTDFAARFLTQKSGDVTLSVSDERRWSVRYAWNTYKKVTTVTLFGGWSAFVKDNILKVGDVCVFEVINSSLLRVVIFRDTDDANCDVQLDNTSIGGRVQKRKMELKVEASEFSTANLDDFSPRRRQEGKVRKNQLMHKDVADRRRPSSSKALQPAGRSNPSFKCFMHASYIRSRSMNVPGDIVKELTGKSVVTLMLKDAERLWPVKLIPYENSKCGKLSAGFSAFLRENAIGLGDECVFELIDKDGRILNVTILRRGGKK